VVGGGQRDAQYDGWIDGVGVICADETHLISDPKHGESLEFVITSFLSSQSPPTNFLTTTSSARSRISNPKRDDVIDRSSSTEKISRSNRPSAAAIRAFSFFSDALKMNVMREKIWNS
jgi:replicative superfamily II helicase